jgi:hypothetical protein
MKGLMKTSIWSAAELNYVCDYPAFNQHGNGDIRTRRIMDIKKPTSYNYKSSLDYFEDELFNFFKGLTYPMPPSINIAIIPSSTVGKEPVALKAIVDNLNLNFQNRFLYNPNFLVRNASLTAAHNGGVRDEQSHMNTITVKHHPNKEIPLILLDDVYTSGASMRACERLLRAKGVTLIFKLALGKTI